MIQEVPLQAGVLRQEALVSPSLSNQPPPILSVGGPLGGHLAKGLPVTETPAWFGLDELTGL